MSAMPTPAMRAQQARLGHDALDGAAHERHAQLEEADQDHAGHADLPGLDRGVVLGHARLRGQEGGAEHGEGHADGADGASRPSGIAVTSLRPSRRARRKAIHV